MTINWKGDELIRKKNRVVAWAINETVKNAIVQALNNHPGWIYRTGVAEGSISVKEFATEHNQRSLWGSIWSSPGETNYVWYLEFKHGSFLRNAASAIYPQLKKHIKNKMRGSK